MRYNLDSTLPINAFSPRGGYSPFALGMTFEGGGGPVSWVEDAVSSVGDAFESVGQAIGDAGVTIDNAVIQPAIDDPAGTVVKIAAIAAAPMTGGTSLYAIPAYTATKAIAAGVPIEDAAKMTAISAAAAYAGVSVADYVGTLAEFGTGIGSQQTAMLAAQNVGIGTGSVASTAIGQVAGGAAGGALASGATGGNIGQGLLGGAINAGIGAGVGAAVDAGFEAASRKPGLEAGLLPIMDGSTVGTNLPSNYQDARNAFQQQQAANFPLGQNGLAVIGNDQFGQQFGMASDAGAFDNFYNQNYANQQSQGGITSTATGDITFNDDGLFKQTNTGSTNMDEFYNTTPVYDFSTVFNSGDTEMGPTYQELGYSPNMGPTYSELGYNPYANLNAGDVEAQQGGYYGGPDYGYQPENPYTNMSDAELTSALANTPSFIGSGGNSSTAINLIKQYGSQAVKALLGGAGSASQRAALGLRPNTGTGTGGLLGAGANYFLNQNQLGRLSTAYDQNVAAQQAATQTAQQQASFTPVGMTTAFGSSNFGFDPATGKLTSAGYTPTSQVAGQVQNLFGMGAAALPTTTNPQAIQEQYIAQQRGLLAPGREQQLSQLQNRQYQRGTSGLATGGTMAGYSPNAQGLMATNPELAAYFNSLAQQDAQITANAPTYAQNQLNAQIATGTGLFGAANTLEGYAQQPLSLSASFGTAGSNAGAKAGYYGLLGNQNALATQLQGQQANIYGQGAALGSVVNPLATAASQGFSNLLGNWLS